MRPINLATGICSAAAAVFSASQNAVSREIDVRWPAMVNERLTGRLIAARPCCVTAAEPLQQLPGRGVQAAVGPAWSLVTLGCTVLAPQPIEAPRLQGLLGGTLVALALRDA